ncbi:MAG: ABC transporter permease [Clostridium cadaveris]|uniref:ABC transporter permease n=1 Tax=Clostridium cadaveris TaxID=1529 RepID=A0A316M9F9_9CLOT|nr:MAG: ABC transporter permease [Clostridium cadaveris]
MFNELIPNVIELTPDLTKALKETLIMVGSAGLYGTLIGLPLGVIMLVTGKNHILENKYLYSILSKLINTIRSIPFVILIAAIPGLIRAISGTTIGVKGAIVPLTIVCIPTMARQIELALIKVDKGIIEAYEAMGFSELQIIFKVILKEGLGGIIQAITLCLVSLLGFSAIAGTVGGGGLGDFAIRYGYQMFKTDVMIVTIVILLIFVYIVQGIGDSLYKKCNHNK